MFLYSCYVTLQLQIFQPSIQCLLQVQMQAFIKTVKTKAKKNPHKMVTNNTKGFDVLTFDPWCCCRTWSPQTLSFPKRVCSDLRKGKILASILWITSAVSRLSWHLLPPTCPLFDLLITESSKLKEL